MIEMEVKTNTIKDIENAQTCLKNIITSLSCAEDDEGNYSKDDVIKDIMLEISMLSKCLNSIKIRHSQLLERYWIMVIKIWM